VLSRRLTRPIAVGAAALAISGGANGIVSATADNGSATTTTATTPSSERPAPRSGGFNGRSGPAAGGTVGTIDSVSLSSFTLTTPAGQKVTVTKTSTTTSVKKGENVLVSQGSGTIVRGAAANTATEAALAAYPGGVVDRVVKLSNGEYEVHNIGVNWPHHIFVNQTFKVVGAD
jgi:hypothetical protein